MMKKVTTFLWFPEGAYEAARFYVSLFKGAELVETMPGPGGVPMSATFRVDGQEFICFNGGPHHSLNPAVSLFIDCESQEEVDELWEKLIADGGAPSVCGWLTDKYGLSWQVIPRRLKELLTSPDRDRANRAMHAMLQMTKIDVAALEKAAGDE
jgi:predicted 3-demethylubiquinone-9 3-methyltransferase (glyoxalase superfamily)